MKIVIYGLGDRGIRLYKYLKEVNLDKDIYAFCDKDYEQKISPDPQIRVLPYDSLNENQMIFLVTPVQHEEIIKMLQRDNQEYYLTLDEYIIKYHSENRKITRLISTEKFEINDDNVILQKSYKNSNYKIVEYDLNRKLCYIFFSSNGIYHPNERGTFFRTIEVENRFEWEYLVKNSAVPKCAAKSIFIRDVRKSWYVSGINFSIDSINKLILFLKELTKGYEVITVGNSAGGYMASLIGAKLNAKIAFSFGGQFSLYSHFEVITSYYYLNKNKANQEKNQYFNLCNLIKNTIPIVYFYSEYCEHDRKQAALIRKFSNIMIFSVASSVHGVTIKNKDIAKLLTSDLSTIQGVYKKYKNSIIDANQFQM